MKPFYHKQLLPVLGASLIALSCAPAVAQTVQSVSQADKVEGAKAHPQLVEEFGGAVTGSQAAYVEAVGKNIVMQSGLANAKSDVTVTLLNSPVNNAFAIPGGYVYVTRELVALMNNEAELSGVLGHEWGHVAALHGKKRQSAAQTNAIIGVLGSVLSGVVLGNNALGKLGQSVFSQGSQLLTLKYSRKQETEADNLGIEYLRRAGYDPRAMSSVLQTLANQNALEARLQGASATRVPEWASTHPADGPRIKAALVRAGAPGKGVINRDKFLSGIGGIMFGDDPKQGMIEGRKFTHPDMRFSFEAPQGYYLVNGTRAVVIGGQSGKGELSMGAYDGNMDSYIQAVFAKLTPQGQTAVRPEAIKRTTINGIPSAYGASQVASGNGTVDVVVFAYELASNQAVHFLTITQAGGAASFDSMFGSMRRISASEATAIRPRKLAVVTVKKGDTLQSLSARMAYTDNQMDRFLVLNALSSTSTLLAGQKVKLVTF